MKNMSVRSILVVFAAVFAGTTTAGNAMASNSAETSGLAADERLLDWSVQAEALWDAITPPDANGVITVTNLQVPFTERSSRFPPLALVIPEFTISDTGDGFSGKVESLQFFIAPSSYAEFLLVGGTIRLGSRDGSVHVRADEVLVPFADGRRGADSLSPQARKLERSQVPISGQDFLLDLIPDQAKNVKRWVVSMSDVIAEGEPGVGGTRQRRAGKIVIDRLQQSIERSSSDDFQIVTEIVGFSTVSTVDSVHFEVFFDNLALSFEAVGDGVAFSASTTSNWAIGRDPDETTWAYSIGPGGFSLSSDPDTGLNVNVEADALRFLLDEDQIPEGGEGLALASVDPMAFELDLTLVPAREEGRDLLRRLSKLQFDSPTLPQDEMSSTPWILELPKLRYMGWGADLDVVSDLIIDMRQSPSFFGSVDIALNGLPDFLSNLDANFDEYRHSVSVRQEEGVLRWLDQMSSGENASELKFAFETDESGQWLVNGETFALEINFFP